MQAILYLGANLVAQRPWWDAIPTGLRLIFSLVLFFATFLVLAVVLYLAGLVVVGKKRTLLSDAFVISLFGTVLSTLFFMFIPYSLIALLLSIFVWLLLIKRLYKTKWLSAIAVGILAVIIFLAITILLALFLDVLTEIIEPFYPLIISMP